MTDSLDAFMADQGAAPAPAAAPAAAAAPVYPAAPPAGWPPGVAWPPAAPVAQVAPVAPVAASVAPVAAPVAPKPPAPAEVIALLANPPPNVDPAKFRAEFAARFDLSAVPEHVAPVTPVTPVAAALPERGTNPLGGAPHAPATPGQEFAPLKRGGIPQAPAKGMTKADRLKFALAALQGGSITIAEAEAYYGPKEPKE